VALVMRFPLVHSGCTPCIQIYYPLQDFRLSKWFRRRVGATEIRCRVDWQGNTKASYTLPASGESKKTSSTVLGQAANSTATLVPPYHPTHHHIPDSSYLHFIPCGIIPLIRSLFCMSIRISMPNAVKNMLLFLAYSISALV
jgi:hypothetical protein